MTRRIVWSLVGVLLLCWAARDGALLLCGRTASAGIVSKVRLPGARNPGCRVYYRLETPPAAGSGIVGGGCPAGVVRIRYLAITPAVNRLDNPWTLAGGAVLWLACGSAAAFLALRPTRARAARR